MQNQNQRTKVALLFLALDDFKIVSDRYGHAVGDQFLKAVGDLLLTQTREADLLARVGGDEFAVLLNNVSENEAGQIANRLLSLLREEWHRVDSGSGSIGIAIQLDHGADWAELLSHADNAMYEAKNDDGNRAKFWEQPEVESTPQS